MPYRVDIADPPVDALDRLVALGALDVESAGDRLAALLPDSVPAATVAAALERRTVAVSPAVPRDDGSIWILSPRPVRVGSLNIVPATHPAPPPGALRLLDAPAFGTGLHPTTALCLEALAGEIATGAPLRLLDVGTGSGVLALAALMRGVQSAVGLDVDGDALRTARENASLNRVSDRLALVQGGPECLSGQWPLVTANIQAAPLVELAPPLARTVSGGGRLLLSGIARGVAADVELAYRRLGMRQLQTGVRDGWICLLLAATW